MDALKPKWVSRFLHLARTVAGWSKDPRTQVGAVAVDANNRILETGYNGLPQGVTDVPYRMLPPAKYQWTSHAEENLVATAARQRLYGSTVFVTHFCCCACARMLIQAGVKRIVVGGGAWSALDEHRPIVEMMCQEARVMTDRPELVQLGIDGNAGFALLGENLQEGESEFVEVKQIGDELLSRAEIRAARQAFANLQARLSNRRLSFYFGPSHPFGG